MKKIILTIGALGAVLVPTTSLIACGDDTKSSDLGKGTGDGSSSNTKVLSDTEVLNNKIKTFTESDFALFVEEYKIGLPSYSDETNILEYLKTKSSLKDLTEKQRELLVVGDIAVETKDDEGILIITIKHHGDKDLSITLKGFETKAQNDANRAATAAAKEAALWVDFAGIKAQIKLFKNSSYTREYNFSDEIWKNIADKLATKSNKFHYEYDNRSPGLRGRQTGDKFRDGTDSAQLFKGTTDREKITFYEIPDLLTTKRVAYKGVTYTTLDYSYNYGFGDTLINPPTSLEARWGFKESIIKDASIVIWLQNDLDVNAPKQSIGQIEIAEFATYVAADGKKYIVLKEDPNFHYQAAGTFVQTSAASAA